MADVKIVDIDNVQWNIKDQEARDSIAEINEQLTNKSLYNIPIILDKGYTATNAIIELVMGYGNFRIGNIVIDNIKGDNIGTTVTANIGKVSIKPFKNVTTVGIDYKNKTPCRISVDSDGAFKIQESPETIGGNNAIRAQLCWIE